ncbi:MAG TPA: head GIN domain-containing protein [Bacteroidales bacterium]|nr:head GIN domain-containing protein [Bacteroidales bacterium]
MKNVTINKAGLSALVFGWLMVLSCSTGSINGQTTRETRTVPAFNGVALTMSADVFISQGTQQKVEVEANKNVMDIIKTEIDGNTLKLTTKDGRWKDMGKVAIYITMPVISELSVSGSGSMSCQTTVKSEDLEIVVSGSGSVSVPKLESPDITVTITGSGNVSLAGSNTQGKLETLITGSGDFNGEELQVARGDINITGSGSARVNVLQELETNITGSGSVLYKGNPMINANATGSGKTRSF